MRKFCQFA
jgi:hypothetical protein